jgi:hypothetical protein
MLSKTAASFLAARTAFSAGTGRRALKLEVLQGKEKQILTEVEDVFPVLRDAPASERDEGDQ